MKPKLSDFSNLQYPYHLAKHFLLSVKASCIMCIQYCGGNVQQCIMSAIEEYHEYCGMGGGGGGVASVICSIS